MYRVFHPIGRRLHPASRYRVNSFTRYSAGMLMHVPHFMRWCSALCRDCRVRSVACVEAMSHVLARSSSEFFQASHSVAQVGTLLKFWYTISQYMRDGVLESPCVHVV